MSIAILCLVLAAAAAFGYRAYWHRRAANPRNWPSNLSRGALTRYTNQYLKSAGWELLPPWEHVDIDVRATKDNVILNLFVAADTLLGLRSILEDTAEKRLATGTIVGAITVQRLDAATREDAETSGIFIINPADLPRVTVAIQRAARRHIEWQEAAKIL